MTDNPGVGDILCYDENRKYKFIQLDTFQAGTFPSAWEAVGVVVLRKGNKVTVCSKHNASKKFMEVYPYVVSGYELDGAEHTATLKLHGSETFEFKYAVSTDEEFVEALQGFLTGHSFADWSAYLMDSKVILQYDNYTSDESPDVTTKATGLSLTSRQKIDLLEKTPNCRYRRGGAGNPVWNMERAKEYFMADLELSQYNPTKPLTGYPLLPVCWPAFCGTSQYRDGDRCLWLRERYCQDPAHPTLQDWYKYLDDSRIAILTMTGGASSDETEKQMAMTGNVKDVVYITRTGETRKLYNAHAYCAGFLDGQGYLPSIAEFSEALGNITYGLKGVERDKADPINRSLFAIGGDGIACNISYHIAAQNTLGTIWIMYEFAFIAGSFAFSTYPTLPFARIELPVD